VRALHGQSFGRMLVILGIVAAVTLCSALLVQSAPLQKTYGLAKRGFQGPSHRSAARVVTPVGGGKYASRFHCRVDNVNLSR